MAIDLSMSNIDGRHIMMTKFFWRISVSRLVMITFTLLIVRRMFRPLRASSKMIACFLPAVMMAVLNSSASKHTLLIWNVGSIRAAKVCAIVLFPLPTPPSVIIRQSLSFVSWVSISLAMLSRYPSMYNSRP